VSQPGEWAAHALGRGLDWHAPEPALEEATPARRKDSLAEAWRAL
jgi:hypothetical protein